MVWIGLLAFAFVILAWLSIDEHLAKKHHARR